MTTNEEVALRDGDAGSENEPVGRKVAPVPFDWADHLSSSEELAGFLNEFLDKDDPVELLAALRTACQAKGMVDVAVKAGLARESLYKSLRSDSRPRMGTFLSVIRALDLKLVVLPIEAEDQSQDT